MKTPCNVIQDLLPLYCDNVCSEESKKIIDAHLENCVLCKKELEVIRTSFPFVFLIQTPHALQSYCTTWGVLN